jgi:hypothetical protein
VDERQDASDVLSYVNGSIVSVARQGGMRDPNRDQFSTAAQCCPLCRWVSLLRGFKWSPAAVQHALSNALTRVPSRPSGLKSRICQNKTPLIVTQNVTSSRMLVQAIEVIKLVQAIITGDSPTLRALDSQAAA